MIAAVVRLNTIAAPYHAERRIHLRGASWASPHFATALAFCASTDFKQVHGKGAPPPCPAMLADKKWPLCFAGTFDAMVCRFELASLEMSFAKHHAAAHLTSDAVGFVLAMAWAAAAIVRTKLSSEGSGLLACAPHAALAAAVALAATAHSLVRSTYLSWRTPIIVVLRVLAVAAGIALHFSVATAASTSVATIALGGAMLPLQYFQLTLLPLIWRLRARQHLVLNVASLAAVASCNGRLAAAVLAQPAAAKLVAAGHTRELMTVIAWLVAQVCPCITSQRPMPTSHTDDATHG